MGIVCTKSTPMIDDCATESTRALHAFRNPLLGVQMLSERLQTSFRAFLRSNGDLRQNPHRKPRADRIRSEELLHRFPDALAVEGIRCRCLTPALHFNWRRTQARAMATIFF